MVSESPWGGGLSGMLTGHNLSEGQITQFTIPYSYIENK